MMKKIELVVERVDERDIDLYVINKFINDINFKKIFLNKIDKEDYDIVKCIHSYKDNDGESDITIILENSIEKIALLIENKIDAIAMPNQKGRYDYRGNKGIKDGSYDKFFVFIMAPREYLINNTEARKYENQMSYEELIDYIGNTDSYGQALLKNALESKRKEYVIQEDKKVTMFWQKYYDFVEQNYPQLNIKRYEGSRGANAWWPGFATPVKNIRIDHKSNRGDVDLRFNNVGEYFYEISKILDGKLDSDMLIVRTGKSMSIRLKVPIVKFDGEFEDYIDEIKICLDAVVRLQSLLSKIDYKKILGLKEK